MAKAFKPNDGYFQLPPEDVDFEEYYIDFFGRRLRQLRESKHISARQLSLSLGYHESYVNKVENEKTKPSYSLLMAVCEYFQLTPAEFFGGDDEPDYIRRLVTAARGKTPKQQEILLGLIENMK